MKLSKYVPNLKLTNNTPLNLALLDDKNYIVKEHLKLLNEKLIEASLKPKRIIVSIPPRHGKSELISKYFSAWFLMNFPHKKFMLITHSNKFSERYGRKTRDTIIRHSNRYKTNVILNDSSKSVKEFAFNNYSGEFYALGTGAGITGSGAHMIVVDDPILKREQALNPIQRDNIEDWFRSDIFNRLEPNGSIIFVMQRWHIDDICGRLLKANTSWEYIEIPAIATENDVLGREIGEPLFPERFDLKALKEIEIESTEYWFNAKYQQRPMNNENSIFKSESIQYYENEKDFEFTYLSYDTAFKTNNQNDFTACVSLGFKNNKIYIIDSYKIKLQYPELRIKVESDYKKYKPQFVLIEDKASGQSLLQDLKRNTSLPLKAIKVDTDKVFRANMASFEMYKVYFNKEKNSELISELLTFPYDVHDDLVDAFTQGINYMKKLSSEPRVLSL